MEENKAGQFLERYREIEEWALNTLNVHEMKDLEQMPKYKNLRSNLAFCRVLRNLLSHYDWSKSGNDMLIVTEQALRQVDNLYYALNPLNLMRIALRVGQVFAPAPADSVMAAVKVMARNGYSYVPIVENHQIVGVFSAKTLMRVVAERGGASIDDNLKFNQITDYIASFVGQTKQTVVQENNKYTKNIDYLFVQESKDFLHDLLCRIVGEKAGQIDSIGDILDGIKAVQRIHSAEDARLAYNAAFLHGGQRILQIPWADEIKRLCHAMNSAGELAVIQHRFIRIRNQDQLAFPMCCGNHPASECISDLHGGVTQRTGRAANQQRILCGQAETFKKRPPCREVGFRHSAQRFPRQIAVHSEDNSLRQKNIFGITPVE